MYSLLQSMRQKTKQIKTRALTQSLWYAQVQVHTSSFITPYLLEMKSPKTNFVILLLVWGEEGCLAPEFLRGYTLSGGTDLVTRPSFIHGYGFRVTVVQGSLSACFAPRDNNNVEIYGSMVLLWGSATLAINLSFYFVM